MLDTGFDALRFLRLWHAWQQDPGRPQVLHVVALSTEVPSLAALTAQASADLAYLTQELAPAWHGFLPGFHRLSLAQGQLQLTLCVGERQALLREQQFAADSVVLDTHSAWDRWSLKALTRCCRRGTVLTWTPTLDSTLAEQLRHNGFALDAGSARFSPHWQLKTNRDVLRTQAAPLGSCAVVGAGLAGASVAAALARRGWQVQVLEAAQTPAAGASGLPVGLAVPHVSVDDSPRSRLSRAGLRLTLTEVRRLLHQNQDWGLSGVLERRLDSQARLPTHWPDADPSLSRLAHLWPSSAWRTGLHDQPEIWHPQGAWIKPARLVQAWLAQPGITLRTQARVTHLQKHSAQWRLRNAEGELLANVDQVVLANAHDALQLIEGLGPHAAWRDQLPPLQAVRGVVSWGLRDAGDELSLPPFPVNGHGSLIPAVPTDEGWAWYAGATYEAAHLPPATGAEHHLSNRDKLSTLLPAAAQTLAPCFEAPAARGWGNTRCVSLDRLPLVGPLEEGEHPSLWLSAAMGSRGLTFALLCAELLAARLGAEPWPIEASLARSLHARRRRTGSPPAAPAQPTAEPAAPEPSPST